MATKAIYKSFTVGAAAITRYELCITPTAAVVATGPTVEPFGIVQDGAAIGAEANFAMPGSVTKAIAAGAIAKGDLLMPAAAGEVDTHGGNATDVHIGYAIEAAGAQGDEIEILFITPTVLAQA